VELAPVEDAWQQIWNRNGVAAIVLRDYKVLEADFQVTVNYVTSCE